MVVVAKEGLQLLTMTDVFVRPGLEKTLESGDFLGRKAGDKEVSFQLDAQERKICIGILDNLPVLGPSAFSRASGIPKLEVEDLMELRLLWYSLELGAQGVR